MEEKMSVISRMINVIFSPGDAFQDLDKNPDWVIPLVILTVLALVMIILAYPYFLELKIEETLTQFQNNPNFPADQLSTIEDRMRHPGQKYIAYIMTLIMPVLIVLLQTVVFHYTSVFFGAEHFFKHSLSVISYSTVINSVWIIIFTILILVFQRADLSSSLNFLIDDKQSFMYLTLSKIDLIQIWQLILISIGLGTVSKLGTQKASYIVFGWWLAWCVVSISLTLIFMKIFFH